MNPNPFARDSDVEQRLHAALRDHLDPVRASVDLTDPVVARSRSIRRHRTIAAGAATALAAVAVAAPLTWAALRGGPDHSLPASTTTVSTSTQTTPEQTPSSSTPAETTAATATTATSAPSTGTTPIPIPASQIPNEADKVVRASATFPKVAPGDAIWSDGKTVHRDGRTMTLQVGDPWQYLPLAGGNGLVIVGVSDAVRSVALVDGTGRQVRDLATIPARLPVTSTAASPDGTTVALYAASAGVDGKSSDAQLYAWDSTGRELAHKSNLVHTAHLAGWYGGKVFLGNRTSGHSYVWDLGTNVVDNYYDGAAITAVNESGRAASYTPIGEGFTGCTELIDVSGTSARVLSKHCGDFQAQGASALSPDSRYLVGSDAYADGFATGVVRVLDTHTGRIALDVTEQSFMSFGFTPDGSLALEVLKGHAAGTARQVIDRCTVAGVCLRISDELDAPNEFATPMRLHLLSAR